MPREHVLKCWPEPFDAIRDGRKRFEWRRDDRGFAVGDFLVLEAYDPFLRRYLTANGFAVAHPQEVARMRVRVTYLLSGQFGVPDGFVVMGISEPLDLGVGGGD